MAENDSPPIGSIAWHDLTVPDAAAVRDFYSAVVGLSSERVSQGDYDDFNMNRSDTGETVAGICHTRGANANVPPQWLLYFIVEDIDASVKKCLELGGKVVDDRRSPGGGHNMCVIQDPAGAVAALYQP